MGLSDLANKNTGHQVKFEFQVNIFFTLSTSHATIKFKYNWESCSVSDNPLIYTMWNQRRGIILKEELTGPSNWEI